LVKHIHEDSELRNLLNNSDDKVVVVKYGAIWCPPCAALAPKLELLANEYAASGKVVFASVDIDDVTDAAD
jgi:thioredoxin 1